MTRILVTGASGELGRKTLLHLLEKRPASDLVGLARDPAKAAELASLGVEVRQGDYLERASLARAFAGIDKLMLTATHAFTDRNAAHGNVIDAAVEAGVRHLVFMPIHRKPGSAFTMKEITDEDAFTVQKLQASGLGYTLAEHPPFLESLRFYLGAKPAETGIRVTAGSGSFGAATRDDLAAAHATILSEEGHEHKTYSLTGGPAVSFSDIAAILTELHGKHVPYVPMSRAAYAAHLEQTAGVPSFVAEFACKWVDGMNAGEWEAQTGDLERLIGRKPTTAAAYLRGEQRR
jgi:NAD(P)H dehydrogenase (quinone)